MVLRTSKNENNGSIKFLYGGIAGIFSRTIVAPLDRIKILMQITKNNNDSFIQVMKQTIKQEKITSLWKGNILNCIRVFPYSSIQFTTYDICKKYSSIETNNITIYNRLLFGVIAGSIATTITHPMDVIRHRLLCYPNINTFNHSIKDLYLENGMRSYLKGYGSTLVSLTPFIAINFSVYDQLKTNLNVEPTNTLVILSLGAISAIISQGICYPLDTIRRRMQLSGNNYKNGLDVLVQIVKKEGIPKLYSGMIPNMLKIVPNNSIRFGIYELLKQTF